MTRATQEDFEHVKEFLKEYRMHSLLEDKQALNKIKPSHAKYFSALALFHELKHRNPTPLISSECTHTKTKTIELFWQYLEEIISELGSTLFLLANGLYKPAKLVMRSTLENFFKITASLHSPDVYAKKSTYEVIELAKQSEIFKESPEKGIFASLHSCYVSLCKSVHTADPENMQKISALGYFPNINNTELSETTKTYNLITSSYIAILALLFRETFHKVHYKNKDIIQSSIAKNITLKLYVNS
jgi:hypothetical protein